MHSCTERGIYAKEMCRACYVSNLRKVSAQYRETLCKAERRYAKRNRALRRAKDANTRARKIRATPSWADLEGIKEFYKNRPLGYHVDHIYPLKSTWVCGLHTLDNLQYLPYKENLSKSNKKHFTQA